MDIMTPPWSHNGNFPNFPCGAGQKKVMLLLSSWLGNHGYYTQLWCQNPCGAGQKKVMLLLSSWLGNHGYYTLVVPKSLVASPLVIFGAPLVCNIHGSLAS
jgi:hypothetical protein